MIPNIIGLSEEQEGFAFLLGLFSFVQALFQFSELCLVHLYYKAVFTGNMQIALKTLFFLLKKFKRSV